MWTEITRRKYERKGLGYSRELSDAEWAMSRPPRPAARAVSIGEESQRPQTSCHPRHNRPVCSEPKCIPPTGKIATVLRSSSPPFTTSFRGCVTSSPTAPRPATSCSIRSPNSPTGRSRSYLAWPIPWVLRSSRAAGSSNAPSLGSSVTAASPKTSRRRSPAPKPGSTSLRFSFSLGDWHATDASYTILSRTLKR